MSAEHTPTPWLNAGETAVYALDQSGKTNRFYLHVQGGYSSFQDTRTSDAEIVANAEFIVRAVNAHDDLVAALRGLRSWMSPAGDDRLNADLEAADAALAKAGQS